MLTSFALEAIDDHIAARYDAEPRSWPRWKDKPPRPWVARIHGLSKRFGYDREFLDGKKDYSQANRKGSRGVMIYWTLENGPHEIHELRLRKKPRRYFAMVEDGEVRECEGQEVQQWLLESAVLELLSLRQRDAASVGPLTPSLASALASLAAKIPPLCCTS